MLASKGLDMEKKLRIHDSDKVIIIHSEESEWAKRLAEGLKRELDLKKKQKQLDRQPQYFYS